MNYKIGLFGYGESKSNAECHFGHADFQGFCLDFQQFNILGVLASPAPLPLTPLAMLKAFMCHTDQT